MDIAIIVSLVPLVWLCILTVAVIRLSKTADAPLQPPADQPAPAPEVEPTGSSHPSRNRTVTFNRKVTGDAGPQLGQVPFPPYPRPKK